MVRRSNDWHIAGWKAILLAPIALPLAILIQLLPLKKTQDRTAVEVAGFLRDFAEHTGGEWDWDDFTSVPITDPRLEAIRTEADSIPLPITPEGMQRLQDLIRRAEEII
jgi:hypothetical protein